MKVVVIWCTHAGTAAILNLRKTNPDAEITVFERNDNISFLSCGIALYVGGVVKDPQGLFYCSPEKLRELNVDTRMRHEVKNVDIEGKKVRVVNLETGMNLMKLLINWLLHQALGRLFHQLKGLI